MHTVQLLRHDVYIVQLMLKSWLVIPNQIQEFCYSYNDYTSVSSEIGFNCGEKLEFSSAKYYLRLS